MNDRTMDKAKQLRQICIDRQSCVGCPKSNKQTSSPGVICQTVNDMTKHRNYPATASLFITAEAINQHEAPPCRRALTTREKLEEQRLKIRKQNVTIFIQGAVILGLIVWLCSLGK